MALTSQQFINKIAPIIVKEAQARGYKFPSAIIAQACLESCYGRSLLSSKYHNYFGMKCGSSWKGSKAVLKTKEEYVKESLLQLQHHSVLTQLCRQVWQVTLILSMHLGIKI